jgi:hypothetical protein
MMPVGLRSKEWSFPTAGNFNRWRPSAPRDGPGVPRGHEQDPVGGFDGLLMKTSINWQERQFMSRE